MTGGHGGNVWQRRLRWGVGLKKKFKEKLPDAKIGEKRSSAGSASACGRKLLGFQERQRYKNRRWKTGEEGDALGEEETNSKRGGGGKAAISVIRKPALARY